MKKSLVLGTTLTFLLLSALGLTVLSSFSAMVEAQFEQWVPWTPGPGQVKLEYRRVSGVSYIDLSITVTSSAYSVSDWGTPTSVGSQISTDAKAWYWTGVSLPVIITMSHTYNLGNLPTGEYIFTFKVWGAPIKSITFTVFSDHIVVPDNYAKIQWAIGNASEGETIFVRAGTYYESIVVNKTVSLFGDRQSTTFIDGNMTDRGVLITADNVTLSGFTVRNSYIGIYLAESSYSIISDNSVSNIGYGAMLHKSTKNLISFNAICNNTIGLIISTDSSYNIIEKNTFRNNADSGIDIDQSSYNTISGNEITANGRGILLVGSTTTGNRIVENNISNNGGGLTPNGGICLIDWPHDNVIYHNNFLYNTHQASISGSEANTWDNDYPSGGNYWSDQPSVDAYHGPHQNETGNDGIADQPYIIDAQNLDNYPLIHQYNPRPWDLTGPYQWVPDNKCDIRDMALVATFFGVISDDTREYERRADLTGPMILVPDLKIDIRDMAFSAKHYGETYS